MLGAKSQELSTNTSVVYQACARATKPNKRALKTPTMMSPLLFAVERARVRL